jgi:DNA-3-methyladenine glycosylase
MLTQPIPKLPASFFLTKDVVDIAKNLLGKIIVTNFDNQITSGRIVETEAYIGLTDRASHSYNGKRTARNEHMYWQAGTAYVYICYGMHHLFNVVTNKKEVPDAVLIRAVEPLTGIETMLKRTGKPIVNNTLTKGPGNVSKALGIDKMYSGINLNEAESPIIIQADSFEIPLQTIGSSKRIGVETAGEAAHYPFRFYIRGNKFVSGSPVK